MLDDVFSYFVCVGWVMSWLVFGLRWVGFRAVLGGIGSNHGVLRMRVSLANCLDS